MKKCPENKILNPETNRCVLIDGRIGKKILKDEKKRSPSVSPKRKSPVKKEPKKSPKRSPSKDDDNLIFDPSSKTKLLRYCNNYAPDIKCDGIDSKEELEKYITDNIDTRKNKKICDEGKIKNTLSKRCVLLNGKIGKDTYKRYEVKPVNEVKENKIRRRIYSQILGPVSLYELRKDDKILYLFGDHHFFDSVCPKIERSVSIDTFLNNTFEANKDKRIDFFIELYFITDPKNNRKVLANENGEFVYKDIKQVIPRNHIYLTGKKFADCFNLDKKGCKYENVNMHFSDIRGVEKILDLRKLQDVLILIISSNIKEEKLSDVINSIDWDNIINADYYLEMAKINRQINNVDSDTARRIRDYFVPELINFKPMKPEIKTLKSILENYNDLHSYMDFIKKMDEKIRIYGTILMDMYTVARMHRFDMKNIIFFGGDFHTRKYVDFFIKNGYNLVQETTSLNSKVDFQCINIKNFKQPFFS